MAPSKSFSRLNSEVQTETADQRLDRMLSSNIEKYSHLLIAKVKDTQIMFSFFVEASIVDQPAGAAMI